VQVVQLMPGFNATALLEKCTIKKTAESTYQAKMAAKEEDQKQQEQALKKEKNDVDSDSDEDAETPPPPDYVKDDKLCWICQSKAVANAGQITHAAMPCNCPVYCTKCAMKMATGGKCKRCGEMFVEFRKVHK